ncbi:MAG: tetratricopeptide repeat protein [Planctomycetaceae bacterium]|nr:tetratricopeptide repeat protein [Planctomycetaceae bacterium]
MQEGRPMQDADFFQMIQSIPTSEADLPIAPLLLQGIRKLELGEELQAMEIFASAVKQSPGSFKAGYLLGRTALSLEKFAEADEALQHTLELDPENIEVLYLIAHAHAQQDMVEEAAGELLAILEKYPDFIDAYYDCGVALQLLGRYDEAIRIFEKRLEFSPDFDTAIMCAMTHEILRDFEKAADHYTQALILDPENAMIIENRGKTFLEMNRCEEALQDFQYALSLDPESSDALCGRGQALFHLGNIEASKKDFRLTVELDSENMIAWSMLGQVLLYEGAYQEALAALEKALELDPELLVYDFRANAKRGLGDLDGALADIVLALEYEPENTDYLIDKGAILVEMERLDDAMKVFNALLKQEKTAEAYRFRGLAWMEMLEYEKAIDDFNAAERLGAENADVFLRRGEAYYQLGENEDAFADFQKAQELAEAEGDEEFVAKCTLLVEKLRAFGD